MQFTEIPMHEVHTAIDNVRFFGEFLYFEHLVTFIRIKIFNPSFDRCLERMLSEILDLIQSKGSQDAAYFITRRPIPEQDRYYGLSVTQLLIDGLKDHYQKTFSYQLFHMVIENKHLILERLIYLVDHIKPGKRIKRMIEEYGVLVDQYQTVSNKYIKTSLIENNIRDFYPAPKNIHIRDQIQKRLQQLLLYEKELWQRLYPQLLTSINIHNKEYLMYRFESYNKQKKIQANALDSGWNFHGDMKDIVQANQGELMGNACFNHNVLHLGAIDDYVTLHDRTKKGSIQQLTVSIWIKLKQFPAKCCDLIGKGAKIHEFRMLIDHNGFPSFAINTKNHKWYSPGTHAMNFSPLSLGKWYQIVGVYDGSYVWLYVDGVLASMG